VIELKTTKLTPADVGQLNFYVAAIDGEVRLTHHSPTVGLLPRATRDERTVRYSLARSTSTMAVAGYSYSELLPAERTAVPGEDVLEATVTAARPPRIRPGRTMTAAARNWSSGSPEAAKPTSPVWRVRPIRGELTERAPCWSPWSARRWPPTAPVVHRAPMPDAGRAGIRRRTRMSSTTLDARGPRVTDASVGGSSDGDDPLAEDSPATFVVVDEPG
jgi:hypothetical protein